LRILILSQSFHGFLQSENIGKAEYSKWARAKPCQLVLLATVLVESTTSLEVFETLACVPDFRNAVLKANPSWLESLLEKTSGGASGNSLPGHLIRCPAFVSSHTLSQEARNALTLQLIQQGAGAVTDSPNEENLWRLSELFSSIRSNILDFFTEELLTGLSSRCKEVCSDTTGTKNDIEIMLAQDVLAQLVMAFQSPQTPSKSSLETPPGAKFSEACRKRVFKLFADPNVSTTLKITVLRLSIFCSEERGSSPLAALDGIRLAQRIIAPVKIPVRRSWVRKNSKLVAKLVQRLGRENLDLSIRLEVGSGMHRLALILIAYTSAGCDVLQSAHEYWK
jgi:hypothetical protein